MTKHERGLLHLRDCFVGFFCPLSGFEFLCDQPKSLQEKLWFSHGLASVIRFGESEEEVKNTIVGQEAKIVAYEIWRVSGGAVTVVTSYVTPPIAIDCQLAAFDTLSKDARRLLEEIQINLFEAGRSAAIYMPEQVLKFERITEAVNEIITELTELEKGNAGTHPKINQRLSHLIQLNSALAYAVSQAVHGSVPLLERPCLISTYSFLGVGTAYRAVSAVAGFVEGVFEKNAILKAIDEFYRQVPGFEVPINAPHYELEALKATSLSLDRFLQEVEEVSRPKLAFFSLRLGFGEAHFSITAAAQVLHAADSIRWSLMTLTHELLHSHVTGLLSTIFCQGVKEGLTLERFESFHQGFSEYVKNRHLKKGNPTLLECLRYMIFVFAAFRHNAVEQVRKLTLANADTSSSVTLDGKSPDSPELFRSFYSHSLKLLEELIVHTLDVRYFYRGDCDLFIELLWESWTTVPAVVGDLETYLLRSLVAVATLETGRVAERFQKARSRVLGKLTELSARRPTNAFLRAAEKHLEDENNSRRLRILFYPAIYIADTAATFLYSQRVEAKLWEDPNVEPGDRALPDYALEIGVFSGGRIENPIPLLASRLRKQTAEGDRDEDFLSAWLLLATASASRMTN